ncbi:MAG TPA: slipin family protein, partial [Thermoplasmatales archaeon]|nr:slipin family protein [Thermoplasmatales archaeon]HEX08235.1 slipin family protein [Thermoplasmatales archaeon]
ELQTLAEIAREKNLIVVPGGEMGVGAIAGLTKAFSRKTKNDGK